MSDMKLGASLTDVRHSSCTEEYLRILKIALICYVLGRVVLSNMRYSSLFGVSKEHLNAIWPALTLALIIIVLIKIAPAYTKGQMLLLLSLLIATFYSISQTGNRDLVIQLLMIAVVARNQVRPLIKVFFKALVVSMSLVLLLCALGVAENWLIAPEGVNGPWVYTYGFGHTNTMGGFIFAALAAATLYYRDARHWFVMPVASLTCALFVLIALNSRSSFMLMMFLAIGLAFSHFFSKFCKLAGNGRFFRLTLLLVPLVIAFCGLALTVMYDGENELMHSISDLLTGRIANEHLVFEYYGGFTVLGRAPTFELFVTDFPPVYWVDSATGYYALVHGLFLLLLWYITYAKAIQSLDESNRGYILWMLMMLFFLYTVTEKFPTYLIMNPTILYLSAAFWPKREQRRVVASSIR